ncbi:hypothetical protein [uncultured Mailhella sp.]|nr:hypothetical protein [uncultured Mailhella sp.]
MTSELCEGEKKTLHKLVIIKKEDRPMGDKSYYESLKASLEDAVAFAQ